MRSLNEIIKIINFKTKKPREFLGAFLINRTRHEDLIRKKLGVYQQQTDILADLYSF